MTEFNRNLGGIQKESAGRPNLPHIYKELRLNRPVVENARVTRDLARILLEIGAIPRVAHLHGPPEVQAETSLYYHHRSEVKGQRRAGYVVPLTATMYLALLKNGTNLFSTQYLCHSITISLKPLASNSLFLAKKIPISIHC